MLYDKLGNISNEKVLKATGREWANWVSFIDSRGGADMSHREIVKMLEASGILENAWWRQSVTIGYEYAKNRRVVGRTAGAKFELGVQKTVPLDRLRLWRLLFSEEGLAVWLGAIEPFALEPGTRFAGESLRGEIRSVKGMEMIRMSVETNYITHPFTLQIYLVCPRNTDCKTSLRFHFERLDSSEERDLVLARYKGIAKRLCEMSSSK